MAPPALRPSPWSIRALWGRLLAALSPREAVAKPDYGADYALPAGAEPTYNLQAAMSAYAAFPWVYSAMNRRASDMAGLPLQVMRWKGRKADPIDDHPLYELLDRPSTEETGRQFREQLTIDHRLAGNHYTALFGERWTLSLVRLHPHRVKIQPDRQTGRKAYRFQGAGVETIYDPSQILHLRMPSWEDDPRGLYGTGAIGALHDDLTTDRRASKRTAEVAARGRPDLVISPRNEGGEAQIWDDDVRAAIKEKADLMLEKGGALVTGGPAQVAMPSWSPRDMEFERLRRFIVEAVLAVTGVPPHLVGLPSANYALAEAQERCYWQMLVSEAAKIEDAVWNPLAMRFDRGLRVRHDFSGVDILQDGRTKRLERVVVMVEKLGADPKEAASYEGLPDMPTGKRPEPAAAPGALPAPAPKLIEEKPPEEGDKAPPKRGQVINANERGLFGLPRRSDAGAA